MFFTAVGVVQDIKRHVSGSKLSVLTLRQNYSGQTVTDGKWGEKGNGFFQYRIWEENLMAGTNTNFVRFLDSMKTGSVVEVLAEGMMIKTIKDGNTRNDMSLTALRLGYVGGRQEETPEQPSEHEAPPQQEQQRTFESNEYAPDPMDQW